MTETDINSKIRELYPPGRNWFDDYQISDGKLVLGEQSQWRDRVLESTFSSICMGKDLVVTFANSGLWSLRAKQCGVANVSASVEDSASAELAAEVSQAVNVPLTVINSPLVVFRGKDVFVEVDYQNKFDILYVQGQFGWNYWKSTHDLDLIFEGLSFYVKESIMFDFSTDPNLGADYNAQNIVEHGRKYFEHVLAINGSMVVALGKK